ncbi:AAA family ATPase [Streptomyces boninensis]|uniref:AAA family ATPase n=1 Tax=Streptomyces boninensis TaxID=2039455 RepID=UPI003B216B8C
MNPARIRILPAIGDPDAARAAASLLHQLPDADPQPPAGDSITLLDTLGQAAGAAGTIDELPEVVLLHERIGPVPALELIRELALRFPAVGVVLLTGDTSPAGYSGAMDAGARGVVGLPLSYDELAARVQAAAQWSTGVRRHLGGGAPEAYAGIGGKVVTVSGAKGGVGTTVAAVQLALAAQAAGRQAALVDLDLQSGDVASYLDVRFTRSLADLAAIKDITPRVLQDAVFTHHTGLGLLLAPAEGERGEDLDDRTARQTVSALRARYDVVIVDCGTQMTTANAAAIELADIALLVTTPDVIAVRGAKRLVRLWDRLQIRKAEDTTILVNRHTRNTEIQPSIISRATGTRITRTTVPAAFKELQPLIDAGRLQDLEHRSSIRQALWQAAGELGLTVAQDAPEPDRQPQQQTPPQLGGRTAPQLPPGAPSKGAKGAKAAWRSDRGQVTVEFLGMVPLIALVLILVWQFVLVGYTFTLAGNSADMAARAAAVGKDAGAAANEDLPGAWQEGANVSTSTSGGVTKATVGLKVPVLFPGGVNFPFTVTGEAGAADEEGGG